MIVLQVWGLIYKTSWHTKWGLKFRNSFSIQTLWFIGEKKRNGKMFYCNWVFVLNCFYSHIIVSKKYFSNFILICFITCADASYFFFTLATFVFFSLILSLLSIFLSITVKHVVRLVALKLSIKIHWLISKKFFHASMSPINTSISVSAEFSNDCWVKSIYSLGT